MWNVLGGVLVGAVALAVAQKYFEDFMHKGASQGQNSGSSSGSVKLPKQATDVVPRDGSAATQFMDAARRMAKRVKK